MITSLMKLHSHSELLKLTEITGCIIYNRCDELEGDRRQHH